MIKLYDYFRSSASYRVRIALNLKHLEYEAISVHLLNNGGEQFSEKYRNINPHSLVPALDVNGEIITQSLAIIEYLNDTYPEPALLPVDPLLKARVRAFALSIAADIHPLNNLRVAKFLASEYNISEEQKIKWFQHWMSIGLSALEKQLANRAKQTPFCFGETPSLADICLIPQLFNAKRFNCDLSACKTLLKIDENCQELTAFSDARPLEPAN